jgi:UDP-N-acetylglucosamine:LPS N-acetylglucosamine transferase
MKRLSWLKWCVTRGLTIDHSCAFDWEHCLTACDLSPLPVKPSKDANLVTALDELTVISSALSDEEPPIKVADESSLESTVAASEPSRRGLKILFLSSDTGGGHRASAESLGKQFQMLFPGTTYDLLDVVEKDGVPPYNSLVRYYKHLSGHPSQWKLVYSVSNSRAFELLADAHLKLMCERAVRRSIQSYHPDVVVSVHPLMTNVPVLSCSKISQETGKHLPMFTVVTDLGSAHCLWFANGVEKMFVGSEKVKELAKSRGKVPEEKLVLAGLPIRHDFAVQAEAMGDRMSEAGKAYQKSVREQLELPCTDRPTILLMGGGEGVGSLGNVTDALYVELTNQGIDALVLVVCGRNESLRTQLATRQWPSVVQRWRAAKEHNGYGGTMAMAISDACGPVATAAAGCDGVVTGQIRRMLVNGGLTVVGNAIQFPLTSTSIDDDAEDEKKAEMNEASLRVESSILEPMDSTVSANGTSSRPLALVESLEETPRNGNVTVVGLGFVEKMAEYMVAADILVSKAGPGTISEAAALSLPVLMTSFLPGQEEGNVDFVVDAGFGAYCPDNDPIGIAEEICLWIRDEHKLAALSKAAKAKGVPYAARDIARSIGESTLKWMDLNDEVEQKLQQQKQEQLAASDASKEQKV